MKKYLLLLIILCLSCNLFADPFDAYADYQYDQSHFATEVISYTEGVGVGRDYLSGEVFNNPQTALSRPIVDTTPDYWYISPSDGNVPVNPVYPPFRATELVTLGKGGELIIKFDHEVANDRNNPYGIDFIIFGNSMCTVSNNASWTNRNPDSCTVTGCGSSEGGIVSVSQDGVTWYNLLDDSIAADNFAPTLGRIYDPELLSDDPNSVDNGLGSWNQWWTYPTNPTLPLDPAKKYSDLAGWSVAKIAQYYEYSAGGTGFDLEWFTGNIQWIRYVKISNPATSVNTPEIDAFSDVSCCGDWQNPYPYGDFNYDCRVEMSDFAYLAENWLTDDTVGTAVVTWNMNKLIDLAGSWLECTWNCE